MSDNTNAPASNISSLIRVISRELSKGTHANLVLSAIRKPVAGSTEMEHTIQVDGAIAGCSECIVAALADLILTRLYPPDRDALISKLNAELPITASTRVQ